MVQPMMPNQDLLLVPSKEVLSRPQLDNVLSREIGSYHILVHLLLVDGELGWGFSWR